MIKASIFSATAEKPENVSMAWFHEKMKRDLLRHMAEEERAQGEVKIEEIEGGQYRASLVIVHPDQVPEMKTAKMEDVTPGIVMKMPELPED